MAIFTLADLHLSFSCPKPMDVFGGNWSNHEKKIRHNWEMAVRREDTVVIPGDISWSMTLEEAYQDLAFLEALPGNKILLRGNHDFWWSSLGKMTRFAEDKGLSTLRFLQNDAFLQEGKILCGSRGWMCEDKMTEQDEKVLHREALRFELSLEKGKALAEKAEQETGAKPEILCFAHYPILTSAVRENPILEVLKRYGVRRVYYGHLHNWGTKPLIEGRDGVSFTLVSSDYRGFCPLPIE